MCTRPNNYKKLNTFFSRFLVPIVFLALVLQFFIENARRGTVTPSVPSQGPVGSGIRNPILDLLTQPGSPQPAARDGIVIGVAFDVSGSMKNTVPDQAGHAKAKIKIAQECALQIIRQTDAFVQKHPSPPIEVGIFEFSSRASQPSCRQVIPFGPVQLDQVRQAIVRMHPEGGTPIGDAMIAVKQKMSQTGLARQHLLLITDGESNQGYDPGDVMNALSRLPQDQQVNVYFFAFDVGASRFGKVRDSGGLVLAASNEPELQQTLDYVLTGKILVEQPEPSGEN